MSAAPSSNTLQDSQLALFLGFPRGANSSNIGTAALGRLLIETERAFGDYVDGATDRRLDVARIERGSITIILEIVGYVAGAVGAAEVVKQGIEFGLWLRDLMNKPKARLPLLVAELMEDDAVANFTIVTQNQTIRYESNDIPAVGHLRMARVAGIAPEQLPENVISLGGKPLSLGRQFLTLGDNPTTFDNNETTFDEGATTFDGGAASAIQWDAPATAYFLTPVINGPPRERAIGLSDSLRGAVALAIAQGPPFHQMVVRLDDGSAEYTEDDLETLGSLLRN